MEHLKNIALGAAVTAAAVAVILGYGWLAVMHPMATGIVTFSPFFLFAFWGLGRSIRKGKRP